MSSKKDKTWMIQYEALVEFQKIHGHCHVPKNPRGERCIGGPQHKLALWVARQRQANEKNTLSPERKDLLNQLDFYWNPNDHIWDEHYRDVKAIWRVHGNANVPFSTKSINDSNRSYVSHMEWAKEQRVQLVLREKGEHNMMSDWRKNKLDAIGFVWKPNDEEELKALKKNASTKAFRWRFRKIPNHLWSDVIEAFKSSSAEHARTGKPVVPSVKVGSYDYCLKVEKGGTISLVDTDLVFDPLHENDLFVALLNED